LDYFLGEELPILRLYFEEADILFNRRFVHQNWAYFVFRIQEGLGLWHMVPAEVAAREDLETIFDIVDGVEI